MRYRTLMFDLDGTLTDSQHGITGSISHALHDMGRDIPQDELTWCVGPPLIESLQSIMDGDAEAAECVMKRFLYYFTECGGMFDNRLYPFVKESLGELKNGGRRLFVVTAKPLCHAVPILSHFGIADYFEAVVAPEYVGDSENKSILVGKALARSGEQASRCLYIGDREGDVKGAHHCSIAVVGAAYGYGGAEELAAAGAEAIVTAPNEWLDKILLLENVSG